MSLPRRSRAASPATVEHTVSRRGVLGLMGAAAGGMALPALGVHDASAAVTGSTLPKRVWAHMVPHGLPDYEIPSSPYGTNRPLDLAKGDWRTPPRAGSGIARALAAGITGMQILQFEGLNKGSDFVVEWMNMADPTWSDVTRPDFAVTCCISTNTVAGFVRMVKEYWAVAKARPSAARVGTRPVIYVYNAKNLTRAQWLQVRTLLRAAGIDAFLVGDLGLNASQYGYAVSPQAFAPIEGSMDAYWLFDDSTSRFWTQLLPMLAARTMTFAGGIMPGYDRETSDTGGYVSARGTRQLRAQWEQHIAAGLSWVNIVTWNDAVERSGIKADADWNITRQAVNAFYSARFRGVPVPVAHAELFVTTPDFVLLGDSVKAEALVLNGSRAAVTVSVRLLDGAGRQLGNVARTTVAALSAGDATTLSSDGVSTIPAGHYVRAEASSFDAAGKLLQRVVGAPVLVYAAGTGVTPRMRQHFYSIPASRALPGTVSLKLTGNPATQPVSARAVVTATAPAVRTSEVIQNTRPLGMSWQSPSALFVAPMRTRQIVGGEMVSASPRGFYVGRVVDENDRVGYSNPVYVA